MQVEKEARIKDARENLDGLIHQSIAAKAGGDQRVIVRPDRSIVIRHRIVPCFLGSHGPNSPSRERRFVSKGCCYSTRPLLFRDSGEKAMTSVRRSDATRLFPAVQGQGIGGDLVTPEGLIETSIQRLCLP